MKEQQLDECAVCGAMVERPGKHRQWHDALDIVLPNLAATLDRIRKDERPGGVWMG